MIQDAFLQGKDEVTLPAEYADLPLPNLLTLLDGRTSRQLNGQSRGTFSFIVRVAEATRQQALLPVPLARGSSSGGDVLSHKVNAQKLIVALGRVDGQDKIEKACKGILSVVDKIENQLDQLNVLLLLVSQINASSGADLIYAGKIFVEQVEPQVTQLAAIMECAKGSAVDRKFNELFAAMKTPSERFLGME